MNAARAAPSAVAPSTRSAWRQARRVLAVRLDNLGDLLMTTPALDALRRALPEARITLLASPAAAAAAPHLRSVDRVQPHAAAWMKGAAETVATVAAPASSSAPLGRSELALVEALREQAFDAAVIFTVCTQGALPAALLCRMAGIPLRVAHARENPYGLLSDWAPEIDEVQAAPRHEVERQLALLAHVGLHDEPPAEAAHLSFGLREGDRDEALQQLQAAGLGAGQPFLLVHPGATAASRRWPAGCFGAAADAVAHARGCAVVFCGAGEDLPLVQAARAAMTRPSVCLAGRQSLGGLAATIEAASALLANNSAPAHLAAAVGTPVAVLYALTNPQHTPWRVAQRVLSYDVACRWCLRSACPRPGHECLQGVSPSAAAAAVLELMESRQDAHVHLA